MILLLLIYKAERCHFGNSLSRYRITPSHSADLQTQRICRGHVLEEHCRTAWPHGPNPAKRPHRSGFSHVFVRRLSDLGKPIGIVVTSVLFDLYEVANSFGAIV